jgi:large subunit ribosomal protein L2
MYLMLPHGAIPGWRPTCLLNLRKRPHETRLGQLMPLRCFRRGDTIMGLTSKSGRPSTWARAGGTCGRIRYFSESRDFCIVIIPSGIELRLSLSLCAVLGRNSNMFRRWAVMGRAGSSRLLGQRPTVRGVAMNPVDHPHGGRTKTSQPELSPWGWVAKRNY